MKRISTFIFTTLLILALCEPARASMVPKDVYSTPGSKSIIDFVQKGLQLLKPYVASEEPFTGQGVVVSFRSLIGNADDMCIAQVKQADGTAFNAFVPIRDLPLQRIDQGAVICNIMHQAMRSGKTVRVDGIKTRSGEGLFGKMKINHIRYYSGEPDSETDNLTNFGFGDDTGEDSTNHKRVIGKIIRVDANMHRWTEIEDPEYQQKATYCAAIMKLPDGKVVKLLNGHIEYTPKPDDPGKLEDLGDDPIGLIHHLTGEMGEQCDSGGHSAYCLYNIKENFDGIRSKWPGGTPDPDCFMEKLKDNEHKYVAHRKNSIINISMCQGLVDAVSSGEKVEVYGHHFSQGMINVMLLTRYPAVAPETDEAVESEAVSDQTPEQSVFDGYVDSYEDPDWEVGPSAF